MSGYKLGRETVRGDAGARAADKLTGGQLEMIQPKQDLTGRAGAAPWILAFAAVALSILSGNRNASSLF